ncbi:ankyrin repeat-containing domain protein [Tuber borchii]|uniref:Ankyrin repeat-containing domain protein n=1 Tax=Tuber borchii TaxID=42251 RepID=A0A2T7A3X4_TUBBO|nr:ankyrin repeat-containing domain protein [Tuber borchii]
MSLLNFPNELLLEITEHLRPRDLSSLLRTSHFYARLLTPRIHRLALEEKDGLTALQWAAVKGHEPLARLLLQKGVNINVSRNGWTALHRAVRHGFEDIVALLLEEGADASIKGTAGMTALHWAAFLGNEKVVRKLLEAGAGISTEDNFGRRAAYYATLRGHITVAKLLG